MTHTGPQAPDASTPTRPIRAVLFDFHGTLAQLEPLSEAVRHAAAAQGVRLTPDRVATLTAGLADVGWVGTGRPHQLPASLATAWSRRDLTEHDHRLAFTGMAEQLEVAGSVFEGFADQLYARMLSPDGWVAYADTVPTLTAVRRAGTPTALVSNIGFDVRPILTRLGVDGLLDEVLLSYEVGAVKPDPAIFTEACARLRVDPAEALMVGDTDADGAARAVGIRTLLLPFAGPGAVVGLDTVRAIVQ